MRQRHSWELPGGETSVVREGGRGGGREGRRTPSFVLGAGWEREGGREGRCNYSVSLKGGL